MSVAAAAASKSAREITSGGSAGVLGGSNISAMIQKAKARRAERKNSGAVGSEASAVGQAAPAVGGDNGRLDTIESRLEALEGGTEGDVTQPSPTVNVPSTPDEGMGAAPAMPEPTMGAAEKMFGGGAMRQIAMGAGKFKK
jgi:hypothetical protein